MKLVNEFGMLASCMELREMLSGLEEDMYDIYFNEFISGVQAIYVGIMEKQAIDRFEESRNK